MNRAAAAPLLFPMVLAAGCATSQPDPTDMTEVRHGLIDLVEDEHPLADPFVERVPCIEDREPEDCEWWPAFADSLLKLGERAPRDRYVQGQVVYSLVRAGQYRTALDVLEDCRVADWWCRVMRAFVLVESGRAVEAESMFNEALFLMPEADRCEWTDLSLLVSGDVWKAYGEARTCLERLGRLERLWWLADPVWSLPGNDRRIEHYNRMAWAALHDDALSDDSGDGRVDDGQGHATSHHPEVVRHGMDFLRIDARWRSYTGQAYRVIPNERALLDPFMASADQWPVEPDGEPEHYVPRFGGLVALDAQVAFFERGDSLIATAAMAVPDDRTFRPEHHRGAYLFLQSDPAVPPVAAEADAREGRWTFRVTAPRHRYIVGIEALVEEGVGRARLGHGLPHHPGAPLRLSDLLLYMPGGEPPPDSLDAVVPRMKGGHRWTRGEVMGVFLEVYGPTDAASFPVSVELERQRGWLARLGERLLGGDRPVNLRWSQPEAGGRFPLSFTIDLAEVPEGEYVLRVSVGRPGMTPAIVEREVRIVDSEG